MDDEHNTFPEWPWQSYEQSSTEENFEDELLKYAIMISLQHDDPGPSSVCVTDQTLDPNMCTEDATVDQSYGTTDTEFVPSMESTIAQSSTLLSLPREIKTLICSFVLESEEITVSLRRGERPKFMLDWRDYLTILLVCRELNSITMGCLRRLDTTIDLRQYRRATMDTSSLTPPALRDLLAQNSELRSVCTKLVLSQGQHIGRDDLEALVPTLAHVELYDYLTCRRTVRLNQSYSGEIFEYAVPGMMKNDAASQLMILQELLPPNVDADLVFICDTLICIPEHNDRSTSSLQSPNSKEGCIHHEHWRRLLGRPCKRCIKAKEQGYDETPKYKTAKLRHAVMFNKSNPEGIYRSRDWVVSGLGGQSFSLGDTLAIHCHDYCLELIERGETLGI